MKFNYEKACRLTDGIGTRECHQFRESIFKAHDRLACALARKYIRTTESEGYVRANQELGSFHKRLTLGKSFEGIFVDSNYDEIKSFAERKSRNLERVFISNSKKHGFDWALRLVIRRVSDCELEFPIRSESPDQEELLSALARVFDPNWWRRQIKNKQDLILEQIQIELGKVHKQSGIYASDQCVYRKLQDWKRAEEILASLEAENDLGQVFNLLDLAQKGVSNLINRRNELMTRIAGFEAYAKDQGHEAVFVTITAPSRYHSYHANPCRPNRKYEGFSPRETHSYLNTVWQRIRAKWNRRNITPYGFRVVEPHHDGTPHWHLLLFIEPEQVKPLVEITREYALAESPNEKGAQKRRVTVEYIDPTKGSAAGYIAKYIAKNIDGEHVGEDLYGRDAIESATRIRAWASNWNIRQFQSIGGPSVTAWRELRKFGSDDASEKILANINLDELSALVGAADQGDWQKFVELTGGAQCKRSDQPLRACHVIKDKLNKYGEAVQKMFGILFHGLEIQTKFREWAIRPIGNTYSTLRAEGLPIGGANAPPLEFCQ